MRLIDADKIDFNDVFGGQSKFAKDIRKATQSLIDSQPTAYDVDEVIKKLEAEDYIKDGGELFLNNNLEDCIPLRKVFEIIKEEGGVDAS